MPIIDNLVIRVGDDGKKHTYTLSAKGISKYHELKKPWHEGLWGRILFLVVGAIITATVGLIIKYNDFFITIFIKLKNQISDFIYFFFLN